MLDYDYFLNSNSLMKPPFIMLYLTPQIMNPYHGECHCVYVAFSRAGGANLWIIIF